MGLLSCFSLFVLCQSLILLLFTFTKQKKKIQWSLLLSVSREYQHWVVSLQILVCSCLYSWQKHWGESNSLTQYCLNIFYFLLTKSLHGSASVWSSVSCKEQITVIIELASSVHVVWTTELYGVLSAISLPNTCFGASEHLLWLDSF